MTLEFTRRSGANEGAGRSEQEKQCGLGKGVRVNEVPSLPPSLPVISRAVSDLRRTTTWLDQIRECPSGI